jgi:hypothetical protein
VHRLLRAVVASGVLLGACSSGGESPEEAPRSDERIRERTPRETARETEVEAPSEMPPSAAPDEPPFSAHRSEAADAVEPGPALDGARDQAPLGDVPIPPENARERADDPPPRPPPGDADGRARRLFEAIVHDDPARAADFFFPREAFSRVKAMREADAYWRRLFARYEADIHALHASTPDLARAEFVRLEIVRRGGWVLPGEEGNALPYHAARHNLLHYRVDGAERTLEVRVLITWGDRWYVTHLSEFH